MQRTWKESGSHLKLAAILSYIILSKENVRKIGTVFSCVLRSLKGFCMANSAVYLDVNIALSKYRFNGVAFFEIVGFSLRKTIFFANIYLSKYSA